MEFGALICNPKTPKCNVCPIKKKCEFFNSTKKIKHLKKTMIQKNINILCYLSKEGKIALTKKIT